jgi:HD superfamily phosphohydrolase
MFEVLDETKVLRDPIHAYIHVRLKVVWDVINSAWFQRLRRIRQLGGAQMVYHCADHTRFAHSLGVYEIVRRMVTEVPDLAEALNEREQVTVMLAGLLHDIGHGPYSHAFEGVTSTSHEKFTCRIIEENTEITKILNEAAPGLAKDVADVIRHTSSNPILTQLISSQLDADRFDYLARDAYFTGTKYGEYDMERILRTMRVDDGRVVVKESGVYAVENYIMARYHMYWQVYYHPVARSFEILIHKLFKRLRDVGSREDPCIAPILYPLLKKKGKISLEDYFRLDEYSCAYAFSLLCDDEDPVLRDLAERIRDRHLFKYLDRTSANVRRIRSHLKKAGFDTNYYFARDEVSQNAYTPYTGEEDGAVWVRLKNGKIVELSNASNIVYSLIHGPQKDDNKIFFPEEVL